MADGFAQTALKVGWDSRGVRPVAEKDPGQKYAVGRNIYIERSNEQSAFRVQDTTFATWTR